MLGDARPYENDQIETWPTWRRPDAHLLCSFIMHVY